MANYLLDLTGTSPANRVINERRDTITERERLFVPEAGAFYVRGFEVRNAANGQLLEPGTQYITLELVRDLVKQTGKNICTVVYVKDINVKSITLTYQCVGGEYQYTLERIRALLSEYLDGTTSSDVVGNLVATPNQLPPMAHLHLGGKTVYGFNEVVLILDQIREALLQGDAGMYLHIYQYIDMMFGETAARIGNYINETNEQINQIAIQSEIGIGRFLLTDDPRNPNVYLGYGEWMINPNIFLYGVDEGEPVGDLIYIDTGTGANGRKTYIWQRVADSGATTYNLLADRGYVNEGETVVYTLMTTGISTGTSIPYIITGIQPEDIEGGKLRGTFIVGPGGIGTLSVTTIEDRLTEGEETINIRLTNHPSVSVSTILNDTSEAPKIHLKWSANSNGSGTITGCNEGETIYLVVNTEGIDDGTNYDITYTGSTATVNDFVLPVGQSSLPNTTSVTDNTVIIPYTLKNDFTTEGPEVFAVTLTNPNMLQSTNTVTITIQDTPVEPSFRAFFTNTFSGTTKITQCNEGNTIYFRFFWSSVREDFEAYPEISGIGYNSFINVDDFVGEFYSRYMKHTDPGTRPKIDIEAGDGNYSFTVPIRADITAEGGERFDMSVWSNHYLPGQVLATDSITIRDTSTNPTYQLKFSSNQSGTDAITQCNEGSVVYAVLTTTNVTNNTNLDIVWGGTAIEEDFSGARALTTLVVNNKTAVPISVKADMITEGDETVTITFIRAGTPVASGTLTIKDTSVAPEFFIKYSANSSGTGEISSINEGSTGYVVITTKNVPNNFKVFLSPKPGTSTVNADDFTTIYPSELIVTNSQAIGQFTLKNDLITEDMEVLDLLLRTGSINGPIVASQAINVNDTSIPAYSAYFSYVNSLNGVAINQCNEGETIYLVIRTTGIANGTILNLSFNLNDRFAVAPPTTVTINNDHVIVPLVIKNNFRTDGNNQLQADIKRNNITQTTASVNLIDTSRDISMNVYWSNRPDGAVNINQTGEGQTVYLIIRTEGIPEGNTLLVRDAYNTQFNDVYNVPNETVYPPALYGSDYTIQLGQGNLSDVRASVPVASSGTTVIGFEIANDLRLETFEALMVGIWVLYDNGEIGELAQINTSNLQVVYATTSPRLVIEDTSYPPIDIKYYAANMVDQVTSMNEGTMYYLCVDMSQIDFPAGVSSIDYNLVFTGNGSNTADYQITGMDNIIYPRPSGWDKVYTTAIANGSTQGKMFFPIIPKADNRIEGDKILTTTINVYGIPRATVDITINDTSVNDVVGVRFINPNPPNAVITNQINEGGFAEIEFEFDHLNMAGRKFYLASETKWLSDVRADGVEWFDFCPIIAGYHVYNVKSTAANGSGMGDTSGTWNYFVTRDQDDSNVMKGMYNVNADVRPKETFTMLNTNNKLNLLLQFISDQYDGGDKLCRIHLMEQIDGDDDRIVATGELTVKDTSKPTITVSASTSNWNEGVSVTYPSLTYKSLAVHNKHPAGTQFKFWWLGVGGTINAADITAPVKSFNITPPANIVNNTVTLPANTAFQTIADSTSEGNEMFYVASAMEITGVEKDIRANTTPANLNLIPTTAGFTSRKTKGNHTFSILDTSKSLSVSMYFSNSSSTTGSVISTTNEENTVYLHVVFSESINGRYFDLTHGGSVTQGDFSSDLPTSIYVSGTRTMVPYSVIADNITEGNEYLSANLRDGGIQLAAAQLQITDTSFYRYHIAFVHIGDGTKALNIMLIESVGTTTISGSAFGYMRQVPSVFNPYLNNWANVCDSYPWASTTYNSGGQVHLVMDYNAPVNTELYLTIKNTNLSGNVQYEYWTFKYDKTRNFSYLRIENFRGVTVYS